MKWYDMTEADEQCYGKYSALTNLAAMVRQGEAQGVVEMYADAARNCGASQGEITLTCRVAKESRP